MKVSRADDLNVKSSISIETLFNELSRIAKMCIKKNWRRTDNHDGGWHYFTKMELKKINKNLDENFDSGYCFLDSKEGEEDAGLIKLFVGDANPRWVFWVEKGKIVVDWG